MRRIFSICFLLFVIVTGLSAQSSMKAYFHLSGPEKRWVLFHPFISKKVYHCTERARFVTDSLKNNPILKDGNGGQLDAFRHAYWMALLSMKISDRKAEKLGKIHERGNYKDWKKGRMEDSLRADSTMCEMDLKNNLSGIEIGNVFHADTSKTKISLEAKVLDAVRSGNLVIIKKNENGQALDQNGRIIDLSLYENKWFIPKVLVRSDFQQARN